MYKKVALNTTLVLALSFLFALPFLGSNIVTYQDEPEVSGVLGVNTMKSSTRSEATLEVVDQLDMEINLNSQDKVQMVYDVLPKKYMSAEYKHYIVMPRETSFSGVTMQESDGTETNSTNLMFTIGNTESPILSFPITILVYQIK
ncbi:MAG: hypothetical protein E6Q58_03650 [Niabella sp.]|nr:MAG: hypothetical protein E6Q58_03650 [Niabella sp.]